MILPKSTTVTTSAFASDVVVIHPDCPIFVALNPPLNGHDGLWRLRGVGPAVTMDSWKTENGCGVRPSNGHLPSGKHTKSYWTYLKMMIYSGFAQLENGDFP